MAESFKKKDGTLKKKYRDMPRFKAIHGYEDRMKKDYRKTLKTMTLELSKTIIDFSKKKS